MLVRSMELALMRLRAAYETYLVIMRSAAACATLSRSSSQPNGVRTPVTLPVSARCRTHWVLMPNCRAACEADNQPADVSITSNTLIHLVTCWLFVIAVHPDITTNE